LHSFLESLPEHDIFRLYQHTVRKHDFETDLKSFTEFKKFTFEVEIKEEMETHFEIADKHKLQEIRSELSESIDRSQGNHERIEIGKENSTDNIDLFLLPLEESFMRKAQQQLAEQAT
jgi:hypothetical protein